MIVIDASAVADLLLGLRAEGPLADRILDPAESLHAPHLLDLEIVQVLRRFAGRGGWHTERAAEALDDFSALRWVRHPHEPHRARIWELRGNLTAYDAAYIALAETLACPLITRDRRLAASPGHDAVVELL